MEQHNTVEHSHYFWGMMLTGVVCMAGTFFILNDVFSPTYPQAKSVSTPSTPNTITEAPTENRHASLAHRDGFTESVRSTAPGVDHVQYLNINNDDFADAAVHTGDTITVYVDTFTDTEAVASVYQAVAVTVYNENSNWFNPLSVSQTDGSETIYEWKQGKYAAME